MRNFSVKSLDFNGLKTICLRNLIVIHWVSLLFFATWEFYDLVLLTTGLMQLHVVEFCTLLRLTSWGPTSAQNSNKLKGVF